MRKSLISGRFQFIFNSKQICAGEVCDWISHGWEVFVRHKNYLFKLIRPRTKLQRQLGSHPEKFDVDCEYFGRENFLPTKFRKFVQRFCFVHHFSSDFETFESWKSWRTQISLPSVKIVCARNYFWRTLQVWSFIVYYRRLNNSSQQFSAGELGKFVHTLSFRPTIWKFVSGWKFGRSTAVPRNLQNNLSFEIFWRIRLKVQICSAERMVEKELFDYRKYFKVLREKFCLYYCRLDNSSWKFSVG